ncbi:MAG: cache domain-containing protein, partial [Campylobacter sp.]
MRSLKFKITAVLLFIMLLLITSISFISYQTAEEIYTNRVITQELPLAVKNVSGEIAYEIDKTINEAYQMTQNSFLTDWIDEGEPKDRLPILFDYHTTLMKNLNLSPVMFVSGKTHNYYTNDRILKVVDEKNERDSWFFDVKRGSAINSINIQEFEGTGALTMFVNSKLMKDGKFYGVASVGKELKSIVDLVTSKKMGEGSKFLMVDANGVIRIENSDRVGKVKLSDTMDSQKVAKLLNKNGGVMEHFNGKNTLLIASAYVESMDWYLIGEMDKDVLLKDLDTLLQNSLIIIICALIFGVIISTLLSKYLLAVILKLKSGLLSFFDFLDHKIDKAEPINIKTNDEFGEMSRLINENILKIEKNKVSENEFIKEARAFVNKIKDGNFVATLDANTNNPALNQLKQTFEDLRVALSDAICENGQEILRLLEKFKSQDFTARLNDKGLMASGINSLGVEIAKMLQTNLDQAEILQQ